MPDTTSRPTTTTLPATAAAAEKGLDYAPPPRPGPVRRALTGVRRWGRETFARDQMLAGLKQLAWVAPLTVLIWVYAERAQLEPANDVRFAVEVHSSNPKVAVRLKEPADGYISVDLMAARNRLDDIRRELGPRDKAVRFEANVNLREGEHQIPVSAVVTREPRFEGLSIRGSEPSHIIVVVDPIVEETVKVEVREEDKALFDQISLDPPTVKVRMPKAERAELTKTTMGRLVAHADLTALRNQPPGRKANLSGVRVALEGAPADGGASIAIEPPTLAASLTVKERAKTFTIPELPIDESIANRLHDDVRVEIRPLVLFDVVISGTPEVIDEVKLNDAEGVTAQVRIAPEDIGRGWVQKQVRFQLPKDAQVQSYEPKEPIEVRVTKRSTAP